MAEDDKKEWKMNFHPDFLKEMEAMSENDPEAAEAVREMLANMRQALEGVNSGQYANFADGVEAITGRRPTKVADFDDEDVEEEGEE